METNRFPSIFPIRIPTRSANDPTQFEQVDETCGLSRVILYLEGLGMTVFLKTLYQSEYETLKFKPFQIEVENEKIRWFEHRCLSCRSC